MCFKQVLVVFLQSQIQKKSHKFQNIQEYLQKWEEVFLLNTSQTITSKRFFKAHNVKVQTGVGFAKRKEQRLILEATDQ